MGRERGREGEGGREGGRDNCYMYVQHQSNNTTIFKKQSDVVLRNYVSGRSTVSRRTMVRNYVTRRSIVSRRTMVRNYARRDVDTQSWCTN